MSRYLAFVLLALSATSVLAAPAEIPSIPGLGTATPPLLGARSNNKAYSPNALHKRDLEYPGSTKDCRLSEDSKDSATVSYTHDGVEYSQNCLSRLALSVPFEHRKSCRTTGPDAHGYDEECLFKKAFDEDWKFDMEKAKEEEVAWRAANPTKTSSDAWRLLFPIALTDCITIDAELEIVDTEDSEVKEVGGKKGKTSDALSGWRPYSLLPSGEIVDDECAVRLIIGAKLVIDLTTCPVDTDSTMPKSLSHPGAAAPARNHGLHLFGRSSAELATRDLSLDAVVGVIVALRLGCLLELLAKIIAVLGIDAQLLVDPIEDIVEGLLATLTTLLSSL